MGIVNELQASAESEDVLTVLRKAKRVASKLSRQDITAWLDHEMSGYHEWDDIPKYRSVPVSFSYNTNGPVPAGFGYVKSGIIPLGNMGMNCSYPVVEPIGTVNSWIDQLNGGTGKLYREMDGKIADQLRGLLHSNMPGLLHRVTFLAELDEYRIKDIPNQVVDRILDWACKLETAGVTGDNHSFNLNEKAIAQHMNFYLTDNSSNKIQAETMEGAFQIASPHSTQNTTVMIHPDVEAALSNIADAVESSQELDEVDKRDVNSSLKLIRELGAQQQTPKTRMKIHEKLGAIVSLITIGNNLKPIVMPWIDQLRSLFPA